MIVPIRKQMDDLDSKIADMEQSIALIAKYVSKELHNPLKGKDFDELRQHAEKINNMENFVKEMATRLRVELDSMKNEIRESNLKQMLEIKKIQPDSLKIAELEKKFNEEIGRVQGFISGSNKAFSDHVERKINDELARIEAIPNKHLNEHEMEDYLNKMGKIKASMERYVNMKTQLLETRVNEFGEVMRHLRLEMSGATNPEEQEAFREKIIGLEHKTEEQNRKFISDLEDVKKHLGRLGKRLEDDQASRMNSKEEDEKFNEKMECLKNDVDAVRKSMAAVSQDILAENTGKFEELQKKMQDDMKKLTLQMDYRISQEMNKPENNNMKEQEAFREKIIGLEHKTEEQNRKFISDLEDVKNHLGRLGKRLEDDQASRMNSKEEDEKFNEKMECLKNDVDAVRKSMAAVSQDILAENTNRFEELQKKMQDDMKNLELQINYQAGQEGKQIENENDNNNDNNDNNNDSSDGPNISVSDAGEITGFRRELEEIRHRIDKESADKISLEKDFADLERQLRAMDGEDYVKDLEKEMDRIGKELENVKRSLSAASKDDHGRSYEELQKKMQETMTKLSQEIDHKINQSKKEIFDGSKIHDDREISKIRKELGEVKQALDEENANRISLDKNVTDLEHQLKVMDNDEFAKNVEKEMTNLRRELEAMGKEVESVSQNDQDSKEIEEIRKELEEVKQALGEENANRISLDKNVNDLEHQLKAMDNDEFAKNVEKEMTNLRREMEAMEKEVESALNDNHGKSYEELQKKMLNDMNKLSQETDYKISQIKWEANDKKKSRDSKEIEEIRKELEEIKQALDDENADRLSLGKNLGELQAMIKNNNAQAEVEGIREAIEKETVSRMSMEKNLGDMEKMIMEMKDKYGSILKLEHTDFDAIQKEIVEFRDSIKNAERNMNLKAMDVISQQMHEFAKTIDKKVPDLVTKDEFEAAFLEIRSKMQGVEAPDMKPLAKRIEKLEANLAGILNMMQSVYHRLPVVLE